MKFSRCFALSLAALPLAASVSAQTSIWTVDDDGPAHFANIQQAINASSDGDTILVEPGLYAGFVINAKGLTIIGRASGAHIRPGVTIRNTTANQVVVLSGMDIDNQQDGAEYPLQVAWTLGPIRVQACDFTALPEVDSSSGYDYVYERPAAWVKMCADLCLVDCTLRGSDGVTGYDLAGGYATNATAGLSVQSSMVSFYDCLVKGGAGADSHDEEITAGHGGSAVETVSSELFASDSVFEGGDGGDVGVDPWGWWVEGGTGGSGFDFTDQAGLLRLLDCTITPGAGGLDDPYGGEYAPDGVDFYRDGSATVLLLPGTHRKMEVSDYLQVDGADVLVTFYGDPGDRVYLPADWDTALAYNAAVKGTWILPQPVTLPPQPIAVIPPSGVIQVSVPYSAPVGGNRAEVEFRQMCVVNGIGNLVLGTPAATLQMDCVQPSSYCVGAPNSVGAGSQISLSGSVSVSENDAVLHATGAPANQFGLFFYGPTSVQVPWGDGYRCVGGGVYRLGVVMSDGTGSASDPLDYLAAPMNDGGGMITIESTWYFQYWYRDPAGSGGTGFNASDGLAVTFCP